MKMFLLIPFLGVGLLAGGCAVPVKTQLALPLGTPTPPPLPAVTAATVEKNIQRLRQERPRALATANAGGAAAYWRALY
jgi:hypothetical protein